MLIIRAQPLVWLEARRQARDDALVRSTVRAGMLVHIGDKSNGTSTLTRTAHHASGVGRCVCQGGLSDPSVPRTHATTHSDPDILARRREEPVGGGGDDESDLDDARVGSFVGDASLGALRKRHLTPFRT